MDVQEWPIKKVKPYPKNPRDITDKAVEKVARSIEEFGWQQPIVVDKKGVIIVGHTRRLAAIKLGLDRVPVVVSDLEATKAKAYRIADNRTNEEAFWSHEVLRAELQELKELGFDIDVTGFEPSDLESALAGLFDDSQVAAATEPESKGKLLDLVNIAIDPPRHNVEMGQHYLIGGKHHLFCLGVMTGWPVWAPFLKGNALFAPYAGPFVCFGRIPEERPLVIVTPDLYTAGHILDRFEDCYGLDSIEEVADGSH